MGLSQRTIRQRPEQSPGGVDLFKQIVAFPRDWQDVRVHVAGRNGRFYQRGPGWSQGRILHAIDAGVCFAFDLSWQATSGRAMTYTCVIDLDDHYDRVYLDCLVRTLQQVGIRPWVFESTAGSGSYHCWIRFDRPQCLERLHSKLTLLLSYLRDVVQQQKPGTYKTEIFPTPGSGSTGSTGSTVIRWPLNAKPGAAAGRLLTAGAVATDAGFAGLHDLLYRRGLYRQRASALDLVSADRDWSAVPAGTRNRAIPQLLRYLIAQGLTDDADLLAASDQLYRDYDRQHGAGCTLNQHRRETLSWLKIIRTAGTSSDATSHYFKTRTPSGKGLHAGLVKLVPPGLSTAEFISAYQSLIAARGLTHFMLTRRMVAGYFGCDLDAAAKRIRRARQAGLLVMVQAGTKGPGDANVYVLNGCEGTPFVPGAIFRQDPVPATTSTGTPEDAQPAISLKEKGDGPAISTSSNPQQTDPRPTADWFIGLLQATEIGTGPPAGVPPGVLPPVPAPRKPGLRPYIVQAKPLTRP